MQSSDVLFLPRLKNLARASAQGTLEAGRKRGALAAMRASRVGLGSGRMRAPVVVPTPPLQGGLPLPAGPLPHGLPAPCSEGRQPQLPRLRRGGVVQDALELHLQVPGWQLLPPVVEPNFEEAPSVEDCQVPAVSQVQEGIWGGGRGGDE